MTTLGSSDLNVFPLALGGNVFGWTADKDTSFDILDAYAEAGGNFIDTADVYSVWAPGNDGGVSEKYIGEWMAARNNRDRMIVATKVSQHPDFKGLRAENIRAAADASLLRLGVESIDLYYAHFDDPEAPIEETVAAFDELVRSGKVRHVAVSNYTPARLQEWLDAADRGGYVRPVALQPHYNLVHRGTFEDGDPSLETIATRENLSVVPYYSLASGFLTGKYRNGATSDSPRVARASNYDTPQGHAIIDELATVANAHNTSITTAALAWLLAKPAVAAPIASASRPEQVADLVAVAQVDLSDEEVARLDEASAGDPAAAA